MRSKPLIAVVVIVAPFAAWRIDQERQAGNHPKLSTTEQLISHACDEAIAEANQYDSVTLDYSLDSLKKVDTILSRVHDQYIRDPKSVPINSTSAEYGAYVGEVIRRNEPGTYWTTDSDKEGEKSYPLHWNGSEAFPITWCSKRIIHGDEDSIQSKYAVYKIVTVQQKSRNGSEINQK